ncbi:hypothetical protein N665_0156s0006 [Sinapis alba]|nr:hypothetical protein N665_0156s0006 [Sinapis alba]
MATRLSVSLSRSRRDRATTATRSSDDGDEIECIISHEADEIETQNLKMSNPQQESQLIAEFVPFSSDKRYATTQVKVPPQLQKTVLVLDIWVFEKSLFYTGVCWRLCGRIEFLQKI